MEEERLEDCAPSSVIPSALHLTATANLFFPGVGRDFIAIRENRIFSPLFKCNICKAFKHVGCQGLQMKTHFVWCQRICWLKRLKQNIMINSVIWKSIRLKPVK